jgi:hypothetical protein
MRKSPLYFSALAAIVLSFTFLLITGCQKEADGPIDTAPPPALDAEKVTASVQGNVVDENNIPVAGATVTSGSKTTTTDRYGVFRFNSISLSKNNGFVKVTKNGYFVGSRSFLTTAGRTHNVRIKLLTKTTTGSFAGSAGGTVNLTGGAKLIMPADAVTDASGNPFTGTVNVAMRWLDPTSSQLPYIMPGDLRGITTAGEERGLESFGMIGVELTGSGGQALKVAVGKTAELTFPIPAAIAATAPATIDLWHFDETNGRWKQEGQATKTGNNYIALVSHFSFWNCDAPFPLVEVCMKIVDPAHGSGLNNVQVRIKRPNGSYGYGRTDSVGNLCGKVPANEALVLEILDQCNNVVASQNIGPFSSNTTLGPISVSIPAANSLIITGIVQNCSNANVTSGAAVVYVAGGHTYTAPVTNGSFSLTVLNCSGNTINYSVLPIDFAAMQQGAPVTGSGTNGTVNAGTLQACGTSSQQFIELLIDGVPGNFVEPPDNLMFIDSGAASVSKTVYAYRTTSGGGGTNTSFISFSFSGNAPGTYAITNCSIGTSPNGASQQIVSANPTVTITTFGPPTTGFVEGNFSVQMDFAGTTKTVACTFRIRRD